MMANVLFSMANVLHIVTLFTMEATLPDTNKWEAQARAILKAELKRRGVTYTQLVEKLAAIEVVDSEPNIRNKLSRGKFTAAFLLQCLEAIGASSLRLSD